MTNPLTSSQYAAAHDIPLTTVQRWCTQGLLPGAHQVPDAGKMAWRIPAHTPPPDIKRGRPPKPTP